MIVSYWVGNGDMHLKNLALLRGTDGVYRLSPAYDIVCTGLYGDRTLTLPVGGKSKDVRRGQWIELAERHCSIPPVEAVRLIEDVLAHLEDALAMVGRSVLPEDLRKKYQRLLKKRTSALR